MSSTNNTPGPAGEIIESIVVGESRITLRRESGSDYTIWISTPDFGAGVAVKGRFHGIHKAKRIYAGIVAQAQVEIEAKAA
jgi:hypothetical protein